MVNKHRKRYTTAVAIRKKSNKNKMRYDYIFIVTAKIKIKKKKSPNTVKGVEKFIHSFGVIRKVKCTATLERV